MKDRWKFRLAITGIYKKIHERKTVIVIYNITIFDFLQYFWSTNAELESIRDFFQKYWKSYWPQILKR